MLCSSPRVVTSSQRPSLTSLQNSNHGKQWSVMIRESLFLFCDQHHWTCREETVPASGSSILCTLFQCRTIYTCWNYQWIWNKELEKLFLVPFGDSRWVHLFCFLFPNLKIKIASWTESRWCASQKKEWICLWKRGIIMTLFSLSSWHFEANQGLGIG